MKPERSPALSIERETATATTIPPSRRVISNIM
jgi:hypothetical protein